MRRSNSVFVRLPLVRRLALHKADGVIGVATVDDVGTAGVAVVGVVGTIGDAVVCGELY